MIIIDPASTSYKHFRPHCIEFLTKPPNLLGFASSANRRTTHHTETGTLGPQGRESSTTLTSYTAHALICSDLQEETSTVKLNPPSIVCLFDVPIWYTKRTMHVTWQGVAGAGRGPDGFFVPLSQVHSAILCDLNLQGHNYEPNISAYAACCAMTSEFLLGSKHKHAVYRRPSDVTRSVTCISEN